MPRDVDDSSGPLEIDLRAVEEARAALYRRGADEETRQRFAAISERFDAQREAERERSDRAAAGRRGTPRSRRLSRSLAAAVALTAVALLLTALLVPRSSAVRMTPLRMSGATSDPSAEEAAVLSLFAGGFAAQNQLALRVAVDRPPALALGGVQRVSVARLIGSGSVAAPRPAAATSGTVTVLVLCATASSYRWVLSGSDGARSGREKVVATSSGTRCGGTAAYATVTIHDERIRGLHLSAPSGGRTLVALVVVPDVP